MKTLFKERAKRFYGNQHVKRWIRNPLRKYVINPTVKATKVTGFIIVSVFVLPSPGYTAGSDQGNCLISQRKVA